MAHFAELNEDNYVLRVVCLENSIMEDGDGQRVEELGIEFLHGIYGANTIWKQTSYNTRGGIYFIPNSDIPDPDQSKAFRKNYAGMGWTYDQERNAFINPKPEVPPEDEKYVYFDEFACLWKYDPPYSNMGVTRV